MAKSKVLIYGANGYTGELISRHAKDWGISPVLAGRNASKVNELGVKLNLESRIADITAAFDAATLFKDVAVLINAAGPFDKTYKPLIKACLEHGVHYTDINGDLSVFEALKTYDKAAKEAGIMVMPGTGFDVVPTDCLALYLKQQLPDATHLQLAFAALGGGVSHGTALTMAQHVGEGGAKRQNGAIVKVPLGQNGMEVDFVVNRAGEEKRLFVFSIPWGDVSTAHVTTGIPNIETFVANSKWNYALLKFQFLFNPILRTKAVKQRILNNVNKRPGGPSDERRKRNQSLVWGQAWNAAGTKVSARLICSEGYTLTYQTSLEITKRILYGDVKAGYQTPATVYGADFIRTIDGTYFFAT